MTNYYLDTSIWLDYYENRGLNGEYALRFLLRVIKEQHVILFSDAILLEFKQLGYRNEIRYMLAAVKPFLRHVHVAREQLVDARKLAWQNDVPKRDALHAILARDHDAILIARDRHFQKLRRVVNAQKPEDV